MTGAVMVTLGCWVVSLYLVSTFEVAYLRSWFRGPIEFVRALSAHFAAWREKRALRAKAKAEQRALRRAMKAAKKADAAALVPERVEEAVAKPEALPAAIHEAEILEPIKPAKKRKEFAPPAEDIPIRPLLEPERKDDAPPWEEAVKTPLKR